MALFLYEAAAPSGELVTGEMDALSQEAVVERLHTLGYVPIRADTVRNGALRHAIGRFSMPRRSRRPANLVFLTQQLATLLQAGLSLDRALEIAQTAMTRKAETECVDAILVAVRGGSSLGDAMAAQPTLFPGFYVGMVRAGEVGGSLDATLRHLADLLERSKAAREQVKSALVYPAVVLATGGISMAILFGFVIPRFRPLFEEAGGTLPFITQIVLTVSDLVRDDWWIAAIATALSAILVRRYIRTPEGRRRRDAGLLRLPLLGDLVVKIEISRFARTLGTLLRNGVSPLTALGITRDTVTNTELRDALAVVIDSVKEGKGLSQPMARIKRVPALAVQLIRVGEETARLDDMLLKVGDVYEQETQRNIERLLALLVPAVTVVLGVAVALVMGSILSAVLSVYNLAI